MSFQRHIFVLGVTVACERLKALPLYRVRTAAVLSPYYGRVHFNVNFNREFWKNV